MDELKRNRPFKRFFETVESFQKKAVGSNRAELQKLLANKSEVQRLHSNLKKEQEVTTLLAPETPKKLHKFFYPLRVIASNTSKVKKPESLLWENGSHGTLINGRLGQGKSILLRFLQYLELNEGKTIPIFIELRKVKGAGSLLIECNEILGRLGFKCSNKLFYFMLSQGYLSLFFDGFDEISLDERNRFNEEFTTICQTYPEARLFVTSRENTEITNNKLFKNFEIAPLEKRELPLFIRRILGGGENCAPILRKIEESDDFDYSVLDSPLLATWFLIVYNKRLKIPKTKLGFYEDLFDAILSRHDGMKESHNRDSLSKLSDEEIKSVFCCVCFLVRKDEKSEFTKNEILDYVRKALNACDFENIKSSDYLYDLTHITCLLKRDGLDYEFIHESIAQYFSASFIFNATEENAKTFYTARLDDWKISASELQFLEQIDSVRFYKYFYIPNVKDFLGVEEMEVGSVVSLDKFHAIRIFSSPVVALNNRESNQFVTTLPGTFTDDYIFHDLTMNRYFSSVHRASDIFFEKNVLPKLKADPDYFSSLITKHQRVETKSFLYIDLDGLLRHFKLYHDYYESLKVTLENIIQLRVDSAFNAIEKERKKSGLYE